MHKKVRVIALLIFNTMLCGDISMVWTIDHQDKDLKSVEETVRVQIQMEQPILTNDVYRMEADDTVNPYTDECNDFFYYCNSTGENKNLQRLPCSCDQDCDLYGNCCWDAPVSDPRPTEYECFKFSKDRLGAYVIGNCPFSWPSDNIRLQCESPNSHDPFTSVLVSAQNSKTYKNVYCALCNNQTNFVAWTFTMESCLQKSLTNCSITLEAPRGLALQICDTEAISTCPERNGPESKYCDLFYAPVRSMNETTTYKNKFCAFCRGVVDLVCVELFVSSASKEEVKGTSYSIIFDIDFWHGNAAVGKVQKCHSEAEATPKCREVICNNNRCVLNVTSQNMFDIATCTKWSLDGVEYILDEDGNLNLFNETSRGNKTVCFFEVTFGPDQEILTDVCISISIACLTIKIVLYLFVEVNKKLSQQTIFMLCCCVLAAQFLFVVGSKQNEWGVICVIIGILTHYFFLASFFWTNILAFDIWRTFSTMANAVATSPSRRYLKYNLYCWLGPFLIVSLAMIFEWGIPFEPLHPGYGLHFCWISKKLPLIVFFVSPLGLILCVNLFLFLWTAFRICSAIRTARFARDTVGPEKIRFILYVKLAFIMGLTWIFGFVSAYIGSNVMWYPFTFLNGLQGAFLLMAFTRMRLKTQFMRLRMFVRKATQATSSGTTKTSEEHSTSKM